MPYSDINNPNIEFSDEAEYGQEELSIKQIVLSHIKKISDICCQEFTGGYWQKKPVKTPSGVMFTEEYHQDVREAYCNSIDFLIDIIYPMADQPLKNYIDTEELVGIDMDIKLKLMLKRKTFKQINIMFERTNFWQNSSIVNE